MKPNISVSEIEQANFAFESAPPQEILRWTHKRFGRELRLSLGLNVEGMVLLDIIQKWKIPCRPFTVDTGKLFQKTIDFAAWVNVVYGTIEVFRPRPSLLKRLAETYGEDPDRSIEEIADACCHARKIEPFRRAIRGFDAWITAIERCQPGREHTPIISIDEHNGGIVKICPLAAWSEEQTWDYVREHNVPYNPLHDEGYPSISCEPCTTPVSSGEHARAGRWRGSSKNECGIHPQSLVAITLP